MTLEEKLSFYRTQYSIVGEIVLDQWHNQVYYKRESWLRNSLKQFRRDSYNDDQRIICTLSSGDVYSDSDRVGDIVRNLQSLLDQLDITNFFVVLLTNSTNREEILDYFKEHSLTDSTSITVDTFEPALTTALRLQNNEIKKHGYQYNSYEPVKISFDQLSDRELFLLAESQVFCIYPWIHLHAYPTGEAYPCCSADMSYSIGNVRNNTLEEIWNSTGQCQTRKNMLSETPSPACVRCYEQEDSGFFSMRRSANKHHGHHIGRVSSTKDNGHFDQFEMIYWDIRFSNLCNLSCRSCGHIYSSSWYQDQAKLAGGNWKNENKPLNYAGRTETDMWEQLEPHLDYVEQIYFAGGEPLLMEEHYNILEELVRRKRFDVRLIYNTNFTHTHLKDRSVFEYWELFDSVAVGASLDADGPRAEYIRRGTDWAKVEANRIEMMDVCPNVDFYISPTLSIMNAWHLPDFHRTWTSLGLIEPKDLNVNILQGPAYYRIDIATPEYKDQLREKYLKHLEWLRPQDPLQRATVGFESAIKFMDSTDNSHLLPEFWTRTQTLDALRNENILHVIPELFRLK